MHKTGRGTSNHPLAFLPSLPPGKRMRYFPSLFFIFSAVPFHLVTCVLRHHISAAYLQSLTTLPPRLPSPPPLPFSLLPSFVLRYQFQILIEATRVLFATSSPRPSPGKPPLIFSSLGIFTCERSYASQWMTFGPVSFSSRSLLEARETYQHM